MWAWSKINYLLAKDCMLSLLTLELGYTTCCLPKLLTTPLVCSAVEVWFLNGNFWLHPGVRMDLEASWLGHQNSGEMDHWCLVQAPGMQWNFLQGMVQNATLSVVLAEIQHPGTHTLTLVEISPCIPGTCIYKARKQLKAGILTPPLPNLLRP